MTSPSSTVHTSGELDYTWSNDPLNYTVKVFATFLQSIFEIAPRGCFHWAPSLEETEIVITEENPVNLDVIERKPAISLSLGPARFNGTSLDDLMSADTTNGSEMHTDLIPGNMVLNCLSRAPHEARFLAWISSRTTWNLRKLLIRDAHFHDVGRNIQIGAVSPAGALVEGDTEGEWHVVTSTIPFYLQWTDRITPTTNDWTGRQIQRLQHIEINFREKMNPGISQDIQNNNAGLTVGSPAWGDMAAKARNNVLLANLKPASIRGRAIRVNVPQTPVAPASFQRSKV